MKLTNQAKKKRHHNGIVDICKALNISRTFRTVDQITKEIRILVIQHGITMISIAKEAEVNPVTITRLVRGIGGGNISYRTHILLDNYLNRQKAGES
jgi:hypothetical protein